MNTTMTLYCQLFWRLFIHCLVNGKTTWSITSSMILWIGNVFLSKATWPKLKFQSSSSTQEWDVRDNLCFCTKKLLHIVIRFLFLFQFACPNGLKKEKGKSSRFMKASSKKNKIKDCWFNPCNSDIARSYWKICHFAPNGCLWWWGS